MNPATAGCRWVRNQTDNQHGDFRMTVPAGDYKIETRYVPRNGGGSEAVMPVTIPAAGGDSGAQVIHLRNGEEQHFDMHPGVRKTYAVPVSIEGAGDRGFPSVTARASDGSSFNVGVAPNRGPGHATISLPIGTYTLSARTQNQEGMQVAETRVTVTGAGSEAETAGVALRFVEIPAIPVDLSIDPSATSDNTSGSSGNYQANGSQMAVRSGSSTQLPTFGLGSQSMPTPQQFGLTLQRVDQDEDDGMTNFGIQQRREGTASFMAPPGTYRLTARGQGRWYILSASFGTSDLSRENLVVAAGASSATIHLVVTNQTGSLQGTVKLNGQPVSSWISLISTTPSLTPVISLRTNSGGTFSNPYVPPGTYQAIAFEHRHAVDFTDPETLKAYSIYLQTVTITPGNQSDAESECRTASGGRTVTVGFGSRGYALNSPAPSVVDLCRSDCCGADVCESRIFCLQHYGDGGQQRNRSSSGALPHHHFDSVAIPARPANRRGGGSWQSATDTDERGHFVLTLAFRRQMGVSRECAGLPFTRRLSTNTRTISLLSYLRSVRRRSTCSSI